MKILKKIFLALIIIFGLYLIISLFLPSKLKVQRSLYIKASPSVVFEQINNFRNWPKWSYWDNIDPDMKSTYEGPESGVGAKHLWTSKHKQVGNGNITIVESKPDSVVITDLEFEGMGKSHGGWMIKDSAEGSNVTTFMEMDMGLLGRIFPGLFMDKLLGVDFEKTLLGLKTLSESIPSMPVSSIPVELTKTEEQLLATYKSTTNIKNISTDIGASYMKIGQFLKKNKLQMAGPVMAIYHSFSPEKIEMECAVPIGKEVKGDEMINVIKLPAQNAVVAHYYGPYSGTESAHKAILNFVKTNNKKVTGDPWEVYVTDPGIEKDSAKWLTEVYYPIE
jgi:effector-binding domain-containing protein